MHRRLFKNTLFLMVANYIGMFGNAVLTIALARYLGAHGLGVYTTVFTFVFFGILLSTFGLPPIIVRNVAKNKLLAPSYFINGLFLMVSFALLSCIAIAIVAFFMDYPAEVKLLIVLGSCSLITAAIANVSSAMFRAFEKMEIPSLIGSGTAILNSGIGIIMLWNGLGLFPLVSFIVVTGGLNATLLLIFVRKHLNSCSKKIDPKFCIALLKESLPLAFIRALNILTRRVDILMLSTMQGLVSVGLYSVAVKFVNFVSVPAESFAGALLPHMSSRLYSSVDALGRTYDKFVRFYMLICLPIAVISFFFAGEIIHLLFGKEYVLGGSVTALRILICAFLFNMASGPAGVIILSSEERLKKFVPFAAAITMLNIGLNILWIPKYGFFGASFSTFICSVAAFIIKIFLIGQLLQRRFNLFVFSGKPFLAAGFMIGTLYLLTDSAWLLAGVTGVGVYLLTLSVMGEFRGWFYWATLKLKRILTIV
jgi:O-antigen/teichoic acid export membrane protein